MSEYGYIFILGYVSAILWCWIPSYVTSNTDRFIRLKSPFHMESRYTSPLIVTIYSTLIWFLLLPLIMAVVGVNRLFRPLERKAVEVEESIDEPTNNDHLVVDYLAQSVREEIEHLKEVDVANDRIYSAREPKCVDIRFKMGFEFGGKKKR